MKKINLSNSSSRITHAVSVDWTDFNTLSSTNGTSEYIDIPRVLTGRWIVTKVVLYIVEGFGDVGAITADVGTPVEPDHMVGNKNITIAGSAIDNKSGVPEQVAGTHGIVDTDLRVTLDPPSTHALSDLTKGEMILMLHIVNVDDIIKTL